MKSYNKNSRKKSAKKDMKKKPAKKEMSKSGKRLPKQSGMTMNMSGLPKFVEIMEENGIEIRFKKPGAKK